MVEVYPVLFRFELDQIVNPEMSERYKTEKFILLYAQIGRKIIEIPTLTILFCHRYAQGAL